MTGLPWELVQEGDNVTLELGEGEDRERHTFVVMGVARDYLSARFNGFSRDTGWRVTTISRDTDTDRIRMNAWPKLDDTGQLGELF